MPKLRSIVALSILSCLYLGSLWADNPPSYSLAPTMKSSSGIMGWKQAGTGGSAEKFRIGMFANQKASPPAGQPQPSRPQPVTRVASAPISPPMTGSKLGIPTTQRRIVANAVLSLPVAREGSVVETTKGSRRLPQTSLAAQTIDRIPPGSNELPTPFPPPSIEEIEAAAQHSGPADGGGANTGTIRSLPNTDTVPGPATHLPASEDPRHTETPQSGNSHPDAGSELIVDPNSPPPPPPGATHTQRLPKVPKPKPKRLPFIVGETPGEGPGLFDSFRLPKTNNEPNEPLIIVPHEPVEPPKMDADITGIKIPDTEPITRETPKPEATQIPDDITAPSRSILAPALPQIPAEQLSDPKIKRYDIGELTLRQTGKWWNQHVSRRLLRFHNTRQMTLVDAYGAALRYSPELVALTAEVDSRGYEVAVADAGFDWTVFVENVWAHNDDPVGDQLAGATNRLEVDDYSLSTGGRRLNRYGGNVEISHRSGFLNSNSTFFDPANQASGRITLDVNQPLLRGAGYRVNNSTIDLARNAHQVSVEELQIGIETQLQTVAAAYWNLVEARGRFLQARASWHRAHKLLDIVEKRKHLDAGPDNLNRIRSTTATRYAQTVAAEYDIVRAQEALLRQIFGSNYADHHDFEFVPTSVPPDCGKASDVDADIEEGLAHRPEIRRALREIHAAAIEHDVAENELLPVLDLVLTTYSASLRGNKDFGRAFADHFDASNPGISGGFTYEIPVRNRAATARERQTVANLKKLEADMQTVVADIALQIRDRWLARSQAATDVHLKSRALVSAHEDLDYVDARKRFVLDGAGFTDLYLDNLIRAQDRLQNAENSLLDAQINHAVAEVDLTRATGTLRRAIIGPAGRQSFDKPQLVK